MMKYIKKSYPTHKLTGVEIGVDKGGNAINIINNLPIERLYLIDPYEPYFERGFLWKCEYRDNYIKVKRKLSKYKNQMKLIRKRSEDAAVLIPKEIDFVYIDGRHTYEAVKKDIELYYPKIKNGGFIGGHDYDSPYVFLAVLVCLMKNKLSRDFHFNHRDWWAIKQT
jgi:hypothetical protein